MCILYKETLNAWDSRQTILIEQDKRTNSAKKKKKNLIAQLLLLLYSKMCKYLCDCLTVRES